MYLFYIYIIVEVHTIKSTDVAESQNRNPFVRIRSGLHREDAPSQEREADGMKQKPNKDIEVQMHAIEKTETDKIIFI